MRTIGVITRSAAYQAIRKVAEHSKLWGVHHNTDKGEQHRIEAMMGRRDVDRYFRQETDKSDKAYQIYMNYLDNDISASQAIELIAQLYDFWA